MSKNLNLIARNCPHPYLTDFELEQLWGGTPASRHGKVKRLLAEKKLIRLRRGLYCWTSTSDSPLKANPFELAQHIYGPSFVSLESALSFHQLIPEQVYTTTSACTKRSKEFQTPLGVFSYLRTPLESFYTEVELISRDNEHFFMAKPWRALCDYIFCYKKEWGSLEALTKSLRIEVEDLPIIRAEEIELLSEYYKSQRINKFLKGIQRELKL